MGVPYELIAKAILILAIIGGIAYKIWDYGNDRYAEGELDGKGSVKEEYEAKETSRVKAQKDFEDKFFKDQSAEIEKLKQEREEVTAREIRVTKIIASLSNVNTYQISQDTNCDVAPIVTGLWNVRAAVSGNIERAVEEE